MSTHCGIFVKDEADKPHLFKGVYCHFDGYPSNIGAMLEQYYQDPEKIKNLIKLGNLVFLDEELEPEAGVKHSFYHRAKGVTVAFHRDRGDAYKFYAAHNDKFFFEVLGRNDFDYVYLYDMQKNEWFVTYQYGSFEYFKPLKEVLANLNN
jgi:hypothetical protein